jgi:hypothetical protein
VTHFIWDPTHQDLPSVLDNLARFAHDVHAAIQQGTGLRISGQAFRIRGQAFGIQISEEEAVITHAEACALIEGAGGAAGAARARR